MKSIINCPLSTKSIYAHCKRSIALIIRSLLQSATCMPIKNNRILFSSECGCGYCCNPKYICEYIKSVNDKDLEIVWGFYNRREEEHISGIKNVRVNSPLWFYYSSTSSVVVSNNDFSQAQPKRDGQLLINTWHGGGAYKRTAIGIKNEMSSVYKKKIKESVQKTDIFVSSSKYFTKHAIMEDHGYKGIIINSGMPRNDLLMDEHLKKLASQKIRHCLNIDGYIVLYAPTHRGESPIGYYDKSALPYQTILSILQNRFRKPVYILKRAHPGATTDKTNLNNVIDVTSYPDMQELLCASDMLITDYSSSMWDYALLGRPCILYMPDIKEYTHNRGICTETYEWPGIVCESEKQLINTIETFDENVCRRIAKDHLKHFGSYEKGNASEMIGSLILKHIGM